MKVIYVGTMGIPAKYGGLEFCVEKLSMSMVPHFNEVIVYSIYQETNSKLRIKQYKGVKVKYLPQTGIPPIDRAIRELFPLIYHAFDRKKCIVHIYGPSMFSLLWRIFGHKVVHSLDGLEWKRNSYHSLVRSVVYLGYYLGVKFSNIITVDANFVLNWVKSLKRDAIFVPYGPKQRYKKKNVSLPYGLQNGGYYIFVGRLVPEKGVHLLIKSFMKSNTNKSLLILGSDPLGGKYLKYLKKIARNNKRIIFSRKFFGYEFQNIMMKSFAHIRPSINNSEGINPVAIESLSYGLMVLASDVDQNKEAFGNCVIYFRQNSLTSLVEAINNLEKINEENYLDFKIKSKKRARANFSWKSIIDKIHKLYLDLEH